jgi:UDP-N-acetyl-D-mannosaminuronate dehydrogenase
VGLLEGAYGALAGKTVAVLGAAYRGGVKETAFSGVFATVDSLIAAGARPVVHDPMYTDEELERLGFTPYHLGENVDAAILQADHDEYRSLSENDFPGLEAFVDGRKITDPSAFSGVAYRIIGR